MCCGVLALACLLPLAQVDAEQDKTKPDRDKFQRQLAKLLTPADPSKAVAQVKTLAKRALPSADELKKNGDWKLPWEFPDGLRLLPPFLHLEGSMNRDGLRFIAQDQYWFKAALETAFVGMPAEDATKVLDEFLTLKEELAAEGLTARDLLLMLQFMPSQFHPTSPTLAVAAEQQAEVLAGVLERAKNLDPSMRNPQTGMKLTLEIIDSLQPGRTEEQLKEHTIAGMTLNQRGTRMWYFRTNNWPEFARIGDALKQEKDLHLELEKKLAGKNDEERVRIFQEHNDDPRVKQNQKEIESLRGKSGSWDQVMEDRRILWSAAVVHIREVSPDVLDTLKDVDAPAAQRLEAKINAAWKKVMTLQRPEHDKRIEQQVKDLKALQETIADVRKRIGEATDDTERKNLEQSLRDYEEGRTRSEKKLARDRSAWAQNEAATYKVSLRDKGENSYVLSTQRTPEGLSQLTMHAGSIRNGVVFADFEISGTLSEADINKDLDFFLKALHERTLYGRGK
jgi:hypothetical protein